MELLNRAILRAELSRDEGTKYRVYVDTEGHPSIGTGRNLDSARSGPPGTRGISASETHDLKITRATVLISGITPAQCRVLLDNDIDNCLADLDRALPWWRQMDGVRQRVIVNMCFNLGITKLLGFKNTLRFMQTGQYAEAAHNMLLSHWADQVHDRAKRLAQLMTLGERK